jgi:chemotaxis protein MotA
MFTIFAIGYANHIGEHYQAYAYVLHFPSFLVVVAGFMGILFATAHIKDVVLLLKTLLLDSAAKLRAEREYAGKVASTIAKDFYDNQLGQLQKYSKDKSMPKVWRVALSQLEAKIKITDIIGLLHNYSRQVDKKFSVIISMTMRLGSMAPSLGMFGTILGLIKLLHDLDDYSKLSKNMSLALIATLYGVFFANVVIFPLVIKLENIKINHLKIVDQLITWLTMLDERKPAFYHDVSYEKVPKH